MAKVQLKIAGKDYEVPAISLGQLRKGIAEKIREHDKLSEDETKVFDAMLRRGEIVAELMKAKYPELDEEAVMSALDMENLSSVWLALLGQSGFKPGEVGAAAKATTGT